MKRFLLILLALAACGTAEARHARGGSAGVTVSYDTYGGVANVSCANPNGTSYFGIATVASHKVLCDPLSHPYFARGFFVMDNTGAGNDESGKSYATYTGTKYTTTATWVTQELQRMQAWGFNAVGPYQSFFTMPWDGASPEVPYIFQEEGCSDALTGYSSDWISPYAGGLTKDLFSVRSPNWTGGVYSGETDYEDPNWTTYITGLLSSSGDYAYAHLMSATAAQKAYLIGLIGCDSDGTHGLEAGPDFTTVPFSGYNDFRLSYLVALASPVEWASTRHNEIYTDPTVYSKKTFHDQLTGEFANVAALNTAWGSSYTTFGTSGTCYGSGFGAWLCPSPSAAASVGTGNGTTLTFTGTLTTTVSENSVGIFVSGALVGGDEGGTLYGPHLSGTINYTTGALSITFAAGNAPANGAAITAEYIANGWDAGGTGAMDEDGRTAHQTYTGTNPNCIDGVGVAAVCNGGYASAGMVSDLNTLDETLAAKYGSVYSTALHVNFPGALFFGLDTFGTWGVPPNRYALQGMAPYIAADVLGGNVGLSQAMVDFVHTYAGDLPLIATNYNTANYDSPFAWPGSACSHSGTTVTCTIATPNTFSTGILIQVSCADTTYNVFQVYPSSYSAGSLVYTASTTPTNASTTCNVAQASSFEDYATQAARATAVSNLLTALPTTKYTADGVYPFIGDLWWQWFDPTDQYMSMGIVDTRDNSYDGLETVTTTPACQSPIQTYTCGGELRSGWGAVNGLSPIISANKAIDAALAGL